MTGPGLTASTPKTNSQYWKNNNLSGLRILAAVQVAVYHCLYYFGRGNKTFIHVIGLFPGVPIFFFLSGLLISRSNNASSGFVSYMRKRLARIYPGLWLAFAVAVVLVIGSGYRIQTSPVKLAAWLLAQVSFAQFFNPGFLRGFGTGALNGSLWTISVELQFYVLLPIIVGLIRRRTRRVKHATAVLGVLIVIFAFVNRWYISAGGQYSDAMKMKLIGVSFAPWIYMFLVGVVVEMHFDRVLSFIAQFRYSIAATALGLLAIAHPVFKWNVDNTVNPAVFSLLAILSLVVAFTVPPIRSDVQRAHDISYGMYLFHMPIVNLFLYRNWHRGPAAVYLALGTSALLATLSWHFVENPLLKLGRTGWSSTRDKNSTKIWAGQQ